METTAKPKKTLKKLKNHEWEPPRCWEGNSRLASGVTIKPLQVVTIFNRGTYEGASS